MFKTWSGKPPVHEQPAVNRHHPEPTTNPQRAHCHDMAHLERNPSILHKPTTTHGYICLLCCDSDNHKTASSRCPISHKLLSSSLPISLQTDSSSQVKCNRFSLRPDARIISYVAASTCKTPLFQRKAL